MISPLRARLGQAAIADVEHKCAQRGGVSPSALLALLLELTETLRAQRNRATKLAGDYGSTEGQAQRDVVRAHLEETGPDERVRKQDLKALDRWMDLEALIDRENRRKFDLIQEMQVVLETLAVLTQDKAVDGSLRASLENALLEFLLPEYGRHVQEHALRVLRFVLDPAKPNPLAFAAITELAARQGAPPYVQIRALEVVAARKPQLAREMIRRRFDARNTSSTKNDALVRRNGLKLLATELTDLALLEDVLLAREDPSEHVRQEMVRALSYLCERHPDVARRPAFQEALIEVGSSDQSQRVRGVTVLELGRLVASNIVSGERATNALDELLARETHPTTLRALSNVVREDSMRPDSQLDPSRLLPSLMKLAASPSPVIADMAGALLRDLDVLSDSLVADLATRLAPKIASLAEAEDVLIEENATESQLARALRFVGRGDMSLTARRVARGYVITRGEPRKRRLWRILHELRTPMPDKRKGYAHTRARVSTGQIVIPPVGMSEVTPTRVPGERRHVPALNSWAPFLPRLDDFIDAAASGREVRLVTTIGTLVLSAPADWKKRLKLRLHLTRHYAKYAGIRDASTVAEERRDQGRFMDEMRGLGFDARLESDPIDVRGVRVEPTFTFVEAFLKTPWPVAATQAVATVRLGGWLELPIPYLFAESGNPPGHLALVGAAILAFVLIRAALTQREIERARASIPMTIGGWGTRGKSGSERIKAALFHGLGYDVVVKTTGCEAMIIHCMPGELGLEVFIYRPYDKATIWEQRDVLLTASRFKTQVFLWECMALNPRFVALLGREWMAEEMTTLTNAYPDHEDIQGPAGEDVARVIGIFMPERGTTFTSEEQMLPILRDSARKLQTTLVEVPPLDADLIPEDLLTRFPYQEHPRNIALITKLAESLGIDRERAMVEMADHVVADLGVLKTYPTVPNRGRQLTFSNGMSANERAGCLASWTRIGLDKHDVGAQPERSVVAVVNNRADRVARSRVFSRIVVDDLSADRFILIGSNLTGLNGFIDEELGAWLEKTWVADETGGDVPAGANPLDGLPRAAERFDAFMRRLKISDGGPPALRASIQRMLRSTGMPDDEIAGALANIDLSETVDHEAVGVAIAALLEKRTIQGDDIREDVREHAVRMARRMKRAWETRKVIVSAKDLKTANAAFRDAYRELFKENIHTIWEYTSSGNQVVDTITRSVAPGQDVRVMGIQNIKGTGLDFVYRWLSIERIRELGVQLRSDPDSRSQVLLQLASHADYGLIDCREALGAVRDLRDDPDFAQHAGQMDGLIQHLSRMEAEMLTRMRTASKATRFELVILQFERWIDYLDSVYRRTLAQKILGDLVTARVGHARAAQLMRELTGRGKGGYLVKKYKRWKTSRLPAKSSA